MDQRTKMHKTGKTLFETCRNKIYQVNEDIALLILKQSFRDYFKVSKSLQIHVSKDDWLPNFKERKETFEVNWLNQHTCNQHLFKHQICSAIKVRIF